MMRTYYYEGQTPDSKAGDICGLRLVLPRSSSGGGNRRGLGGSRGLAAHCAIGASLDKVYRDKFILWLELRAVRGRLSKQDKQAEFAKALETVSAR